MHTVLGCSLCPPFSLLWYRWSQQRQWKLTEILQPSHHSDLPTQHFGAFLTNAVAFPREKAASPLFRSGACWSLSLHLLSVPICTHVKCECKYTWWNLAASLWAQNGVHQDPELEVSVFPGSTDRKDLIVEEPQGKPGEFSVLRSF